MKKTAIYATFAAALFFSACGGETEAVEETTAIATEEVAAEAPVEGEAYALVLDQSNVKWHGEKVAGAHDGEIAVKDGQLLVADGELTGGEIVIDMTTITNTDLTAEEDNAKLVGHLKSDDFFGVEKHPTATFEITNATPIENAAAGAANYNVEGNLTIKGKTEPVSFPAVVVVENGTVNAKADVTVDRSKYDVRYGSETLLGELGDKAISDEFIVTFDVTAKQ